MDGLSPAAATARHRTGNLRGFAALALLLGGLAAGPAEARCAVFTLPDRFARAERVYLATIEAIERTRRFPPPGYDPDADVEVLDSEEFRVVLQVERDFKGRGAERREFRIDDGIVVLGGTPLSLHDQRVGTRVLMFEPHWDSGCSGSKVVESDRWRDLAAELERLARATAQPE